MELGGKINKSMVYVVPGEVVLCLQVGESFALCVQERGVSQPFPKLVFGLFSSR